jgi:hypothetical protein
MSTKRTRTKRSKADEINEKLMFKRHCTRKKTLVPTTVFITQDQFNDVIRFGKPEEVYQTIQRYPEMVIGIDEDGFCPLMCVADRKFTSWEDADEMVSVLIHAGAKMHSGCYFLTTPLYYAASKSPHILQAFVRYEMRWNTYSGNPITPWRVALYASSNNFEIILPYIPPEAANYKNAFGQTLLVEVIMQWPALTIKMLAHAHFRALIEVPDDNGETPLAHAAKLTYNRHDATQALLDCGADVIFKQGYRRIYYSDADNQKSYIPRSTAAVNYIRHRITHGFDHSPFEIRHLNWYK